jgi:hypothetical protein
VVGDGEAEQEGGPARDAVQAPEPVRRGAQRQPAVHPQRRAELDHRQQDRRAGEPHLHRDRVVEAERDRQVARGLVRRGVDP